MSPCTRRASASSPDGPLIRKLTPGKLSRETTRCVDKDSLSMPGKPDQVTTKCASRGGLSTQGRDHPKQVVARRRTSHASCSEVSEARAASVMVCLLTE